MKSIKTKSDPFETVFKLCFFNKNVFSRLVGRGPFLERPGNLTGLKSCFEIKVSRKVGCVLTSNKDDFVSRVENFTV